MRKDINPLIEQQRPAKEKENQEKAAKDKEKASQQQERNSHIYIGDPEKKIIDVFGQPERVNKTVNSNLVRKQYVYKNGVVTTFQTSN